MKRLLPLVLVLALCAAAITATAAEKKTDPKSARGKSAAAAKTPETRWKSDAFSGLSFRSLGPALMSGRIGDLALHPSDWDTWYVAVASGGVWKTTNHGTTFTPVFDAQGSYSIGCVTVDPNDPLTVWVGTGENNSQRSVGYGDGVYKSVDGGRTWENVGLGKSEHIGKILVDPRDSKVVYVAAQGPLWSAGGDRGLYRTVDGGRNWNKVLDIDEHTGVSDLWFDPRDPDVLYATSYQRHRRVWTLINGGPGSGIWKSTDAGSTWKKINKGLPDVELGRIGLAISPAAPTTIYAIVEAAERKGGVFRSVDGGANWEKRSDYVSTSPQYYQELVPDPQDADRVYSMDTWMHVTEDGGKTWRRVGERYKHVDNHAMIIDPANTEHMLAGCDGGLYETWDRGATWEYYANLPITQFYKICVDDAKPFYNIYGGTQDNNTIGGPVGTNNDHGLRNSDWFITVGGDGFQPRVDPTQPDIVYSQWQHGELVRYDKRTGEIVHIQPQPEPGDAPPHWNWDSPLIISPHSPTRLYFASQRVWRTDDRGDHWRPVSPDLTRQLDRNRLEVADRVWSVDAVAKNASTSFYGNLVSLSESPRQEGLLYAGSDDGLVQVSEDGGGSWRKVERFPGVPELSYVSRLEASQHDASTVYAAFDNHKMGDFKPYVLKSADRGRTWTSIAGDLPGRGTVYALAEDHVDPQLLFAGTEFGVFFTRDGGRRWVQLKSGLPVICVRDLAIQKRENDLAVGTFGRGFYLLEDYSPLRSLDDKALEAPNRLLPVPDALAFHTASPLGGPGKSSQGDGFFTSPNPAFGATFTYYLRDDLKTSREVRREAEKKLAKDGKDVFYPSWDSLRLEDREEAPAVLLTVTDAQGNVVRRLKGPAKAGFNRVSWDLRYPPVEPTSLEAPPERAPWETEPVGPMVVPGRYQVSLAQRVQGQVTALAGPEGFEVRPLGAAVLPAKDQAAVLAFQQKTARLQRAVLGANRAVGEGQRRVAHLKKAIDDTPGAPASLAVEARRIESALLDLQEQLNGDPVKGRRNEATSPSISARVENAVYGSWYNSQELTGTHQRSYEIAAAEYAKVQDPLRRLLETELPALERQAEAAGAPWTPGRVPYWQPE